MLRGIRGYLLGSYLFLLIVTLSVTALALILILNARPAPPQQTYDELVQFARYNLRGAFANRPIRPGAVAATLDNLVEVAQESDIRILVINGATETVESDSAGLFQAGDSIDTEPILRPTQTLPPDRRLRLPVEYTAGEINLQEAEWLYIGIRGTGPVGQNRHLILAKERPTTSLAQALVFFGAELGPALLQAGLVGLVASATLAVLISRNLAQPLLTLAHAAHAVAHGDYDKRVPLSGPQEMRDVARSFNYMSEKVQVTQQAQRDLMANVSHDLKTPLTSIQGFSQAIMDGAAPDPVRAAAVIHDEAARLARMVTQLTELARLQAGRLDMQRQPIDVGSMVLSIAERLSVVAEKKGISLHTDAASGMIVQGNGDKLAQVITNLLSNAIKYTPDNGQVLATVKPEQNGFCVSVRDNGIGIKQEDLSRVFERFYQVDKSRGPRRGSGLGLAITREIVETHGGHVQVASDGLGKGSTFSVWLPA